MPDRSSPLRILRPEDLLVLELEFTNIRIVDDGRHLVKVDAAAPGVLVFRFPAQYIAERTFCSFAAGNKPARV